MKRKKFKLLCLMLAIVMMVLAAPSTWAIEEVETIEIDTKVNAISSSTCRSMSWIQAGPVKAITPPTICPLRHEVIRGLFRCESCGKLVQMTGCAGGSGCSFGLVPYRIMCMNVN